MLVVVAIVVEVFSSVVKKNNEHQQKYWTLGQWKHVFLSVMNHASQPDLDLPWCTKQYLLEQVCCGGFPVPCTVL